MSKDQRHYEAEELALGMMRSMLARIRAVWNAANSERCPNVTISTIFKHVFSEARMAKDESIVAKSRYMMALESVESFFGIDCHQSSSVDGFLDFFSNHELDDLHERSHFITEINENGRKLVSVSPYLGISEDWNEWITNFADKIFLDPSGFLTELETFENRTKLYLEWRDINRFGGDEIYPIAYVYKLREFAKKLLSGEA